MFMDEIKDDFWLMLELFITGFLIAGTTDGVVLLLFMKLKLEPFDGCVACVVAG